MTMYAFIVRKATMIKEFQSQIDENESLQVMLFENGYMLLVCETDEHESVLALSYDDVRILYNMLSRFFMAYDKEYGRY